MDELHGIAQHAATIEHGGEHTAVIVNTGEELAGTAHAVAEHAAAGHENPADYIMHHLKDGSSWEVPGAHGFADHLDLKQTFGDWSVTIGGKVLELSMTKHILFLFISAIVLTTILFVATRGRKSVPKGRLQTGVEALFLFVRDDIARANIHHHPEKYVPYLCTAFFWILSMNLLGLMPYGAAPTGNLSVTAVLAILTFGMTQLAGMRGQGVVGYWLHLVPKGTPVALYPLVFVIEFVGLFTKPFALMMRLFANEMAGHIMIYFLIGLFFFMKSFAIAPIAIGMSVAIYMLEVMVAFIQAYIFTILSAVFIGMASESH